MKYLIIICLSISFLNASMLLDKNYPLCIESYYVKGGELFYLRSSDNVYYSTAEDHSAQKIIHNYSYDSVNGVCFPSGVNNLGLSTESYNFLLALVGVIFGGVFLFFTVDAFIKVGSRK